MWSRHEASSGPQAARGFTLIEVMVVVAIITILATIGILVGVQVRGRAAENSTRSTLTALDGALSAFLKHHPEPTAANWMTALRASGTAGSVKFETSEGQLRVLDGWGSPIGYLPANSPGNLTPMGRFRSNGLDGVENTGDDIFSAGAAAE